MAPWYFFLYFKRWQHSFYVSSGTRSLSCRGIWHLSNRHKTDVLSLNSWWLLTARATLLSHWLNSILATQYSYYSTWLRQFILLVLNVDDPKIATYCCRWPIFDCQLGLVPVRCEVIAFFVMQLLSPLGNFPCGKCDVRRDAICISRC